MNNNNINSIGNQHNKVAIVTGATGNVAPHVIDELTKQGYKVIACSRRDKASDPYSNVTWLKTSGDDISRKEFWDNVIEKYAAEAENLLVVSTIGTARARGEKTLEQVNKGMVIPITKAASDFAEKKVSANVTVTHVSSLAAQVIPDDEYGKVKLAVDNKIVEIGKTGGDNFHTVVFEPGYIFPGAKEGSDGVITVDDGHPWSMEQIVQLGALPSFIPYFGNRTICPIAGSGNQKQQPVSITNLAQAIVNTAKVDDNQLKFSDSEIVVAVGPNVMTQKEVIDFYAGMMDRDVLHISVPSGIIATVTHYFGYGRLEDFSAKMMQSLDKNNQEYPLEPFKKYLNDDQEMIAIEDVYPSREDAKDKQIILRSPPITDHIFSVTQTIKNNPMTLVWCTTDTLWTAMQPTIAQLYANTLNGLLLPIAMNNQGIAANANN